MRYFRNLRAKLHVIDGFLCHFELVAGKIMLRLVHGHPILLCSKVLIQIRIENPFRYYVFFCISASRSIEKRSPRIHQVCYQMCMLM